MTDPMLAKFRHEQAQRALRRSRRLRGVARAGAWAAAFVGLGILLALCGGAVPVTVRPQQSADGKPMPVPVALTAPVPAEPVAAFAPVDAQPAPSADWLGILTGGIGLLGGTGAAAWAARAIGRYRSALRLTAGLADRLADAPDDAAVSAAKRDAAAAQQAAGVRGLVQGVRGKS